MISYVQILIFQKNPCPRLPDFQLEIPVEKTRLKFNMKERQRINLWSSTEEQRPTVQQDIAWIVERIDENPRERGQYFLRYSISDTPLESKWT